MSKKILLIQSSMNGQGGLEKQISNIIYTLQKKDCELTLATQGHPPSLLSINYISHSPRCFFKSLKIKSFDNFVKNVQKKRQFDLSLSFDRTSTQSHIRLGNGLHKVFLEAKKIYKPAIFSRPIDHLLCAIEEKALLFPGLRLAIANSQMVKEEVLKHYKVDPNKISVVHNGVEFKATEKEFENSFSENLATNFGLNQEHVHFLFIGNGYQRKGLDIVLRAFAFLKKDSFHLSIIGKDKKINDYKKLAADLKIDEQVSFFGPQKDILNFYKYADIFLLPSYYDPFANVTVEAIAMGLFTITSSKNGGKEVINTKNGYVMNSFTPQELAAAIEPLGKKEKNSSLEIRNTVKHLELSDQLNQFTALLDV